VREVLDSPLQGGQKTLSLLLGMLRV